MLSIYLLVALFFVFGTMIELTINLKGQQKFDTRNNKSKIDYDKEEIDKEHYTKEGRFQNVVQNARAVKDISTISGITGTIENRTYNNFPDYSILFKEKLRGEKLDLAAFALFNSFFLAFNLIYFGICLKL